MSADARPTRDGADLDSLLLQETAAELLNALGEEIDRGGLSDILLSRLVDHWTLAERGWRPRCYGQLVEWTWGALHINGCLPVMFNRGILVEIAWAATEAGATWDEVAPWLRMIAAATEQGPYARLVRFTQTWDDHLAPVEDRAAEWTRCAGDLAPLAWAAGLTLTETRGRAATGTLVAEAPRLRLLAGLRGFRLP